MGIGDLVLGHQIRSHLFESFDGFTDEVLAAPALPGPVGGVVDDNVSGDVVHGLVR